MKGIQEVLTHLPDLVSPVRSIWIGIFSIGLFCIMTIFLVNVNRYIPEWSLDGQVILIAIGFLVLRMFFTNKNSFLFRYGDLAYRNAFVRFVLPGLALIFAAIIHIGYMQGPSLPIRWWTSLLPIVGWYFLLIGIVLWIRSITIFGLDNLMMLYVYFPEKSRRVDHNIYNVLRHPVYAGVLRVSIGLALSNGNAFAVFFGILLMPLALTVWVRLVEEQELIERFGSSYVEYRNATPAFWPRLRNLSRFYRFLLKG